ncbi:hypothetical protein [Chryseobacterium caseinilyticum]|uniref:Addiction module protein n=1 Tax=Chryseobacterium caseinilyticum TaxID=2771428 RepID=A0ABR8Z9I5_9FLAO|nr:hypothetical protein [Chryseobacterium caseinilyticum]MBD8081922.1 hypothetical protein [Chryseobacterium caseinilyticum]
MENPIVQSKTDLIHWINKLDDLEVIAELLELKEKRATADTLSESQTEYLAKDDFDERFSRGLNSGESREKTREFISKLSWGK